MNEYQRKKMFAQHYGEGEGVCLTNGKVVPELVVGRLEEVVEEVYEMQEKQLRVTTYKGVPGPTAPEWTVIIGEFLRGKLSILSQLRVKTDYMKRLPVKFRGLAVLDEAKSRTIASEIIEAFDKDPRREVHLRATWSVMRQGAAFQAQLRLFAHGANRSELHLACRMQIAIFRFPCCGNHD
jgi:hypothetical protein